jgi:transcriptional regulator
MEYKSPRNFRHLHRQCRLPQLGQTPVIEFNQNVEMGPFPRPTMETGSLSVLNGHRLQLQTLREVLESDSYQVALVPRDGGHIRGSQAEPLLAAAPAVLFSFSWTELVARVGELARDSNDLAECRGARFEDVCVDFTKIAVSRTSGEPITLTTQEFKTLKCFLLNPDRVFSRDELLHEAWGYENYPSTRTVDNHVLKLRQKLERDPARPVHFLTVHGVGYKFVR